MEYKKLTRESFNIHYIKTDRFKAINIDIYFTKEFNKNDISYSNLLCKMFTYTSKRYNTKNKFAIKLEELYSMKCSSIFGMRGNAEYINLSLEFLNPKYTEESMYESSLNFLREILFNPHVDNEKFDENTFEVNRNSLLSQLDAIKVDPSLSSRIKFRSIMYKGTPTEHSVLGEEKEYKNINSKELYKFYKTLFKDYKIDIFIVGDTSKEDILVNKIDKMFKNVETNKTNPIDLYIKYKYNKNINEIKEKGNFNQSQLYMGYRVKDITEFELKYVLTIYNIILGNLSNSMLFESLRTKNSLCYNIVSRRDNFNTSIFINSGINKVNYEESVKLIKKSIKDMTEIKKVKPKLNVAIKSMNTVLNDFYDDVYSIIGYYYNLEFEWLDSIEERRKKFMNIKEEDIVNFGKKLYLTTIYLLEGEKE